MSEEDNDKVGYGRPRKHSQFKPGQSGNPAGRPKGAKNKRPPPGWRNQRLQTFIDEAYRLVSVKDAGGVMELPAYQAIMRQLAVKAIKGDHRSQKFVLGQLDAIDDAARARHDSFLETIIDYKANWRRAFAEYDAAGEPRPEPVPHPDQLEIESETGNVYIRGPKGEDEAKKIKALRAILVSHVRELEKKRRFRRILLRGIQRIHDAGGTEVPLIAWYNSLSPVEIEQVPSKLIPMAEKLAFVDKEIANQSVFKTTAEKALASWFQPRLVSGSELVPNDDWTSYQT